MDHPKAIRVIKVSRHGVSKTRIMLGGLLAISLVIMQDFISIGVFVPTKTKPLDIPALISVLAFALALPLLATHLIVNFEDGSRKYTINDTLGLKIAYFLGIGSDLVGVVTAFWYISLAAGIVVLASIIIGIALCVHYTIQLRLVDNMYEAEGLKNMD